MTQAIEVEAKYPAIVYDVAEAAIAEAKEAYEGLAIADGDAKSYKVVAQALSGVKSWRTGVEKARKTQKAPALAYGKAIDTEAKRLTALILEVEEPLAATKATVDDEKARIKAEKEAAEAKRVGDIKASVAAIAAMSVSQAGDTADHIRARLGTVLDLTLDKALYMEFYEQAEGVLADAIETLTAAVDERDAFEAQQAELDERNRLANEKQAEIDKREADVKAKEDKAMADEQAKADEEMAEKQEAYKQKMSEELAEEERIKAQQDEVFKFDREKIENFIGNLDACAETLPGCETEFGIKVCECIKDRLAMLREQIVEMVKEGE